MHVPEHFREDDPETLAHHIREHGFGLLIVADMRGSRRTMCPSCSRPARHEAGRDVPWAVDGAPADFTDRLVGAIVGVEIRVETLTGKLKASQNQPEQNRAGVRAGLEQAEPGGRAMARLIR